MTNIKAICFDLDGVYFTQKGKEEFNKWLASFGLSEEQIQQFHWSDEMKKLVRGAISNSDFCDFVRKIIGSDISDDEIALSWVRGYEVSDEVRDSVLSAKRQGFITCVCTNNNAIRVDALQEKFNFKNDFDCFASSHEVGDVKPSRVIFERLIDRSGVIPSEIIYADDNADRLEGARELGIETFVFHDFDQFITQLKSRGIDLSSEVSEAREIR
jgi:HAD superfamily hydrolase (TIGR01509 family)